MTPPATYEQLLDDLLLADLDIHDQAELDGLRARLDAELDRMIQADLDRALSELGWPAA